MIENNENVEKSKIDLVPVREPVIYTTITLLVMCTLLVGFSYYWNINALHQDKISAALAEAKANWNKDQAFRVWASRHGGLYVKPDKRTQPSPYLSHLPHRDITTTDGKMLTLLNPAFMMRQMIEEYESNYGIKGSITAKQLLNPINKADEWELKALTEFEKGKPEIYGEQIIDGEPYFRYMKPMKVKKSCLKCHDHHHKVGDIHGGVSVSIPLKPHLNRVDSTTQSILITHLLVLFLGYLGIFAYGWIAKKRERERLNFEHERQRHQDSLEETVINRTKELKENVTRLDQIMDTAAEGIISSNENGTIERFNHAAEDIFGYHASEVIGKNISIFIHASKKHDHDNYIKQYLKTAKSDVFNMGREIEAQRKDGSIFPASISISDTHFDDKRIFTSIIHDITSVKEHELALVDAKEEAEKANKIKSDFLSSMSHDLRTPLNAILGFTQLLELNPTEPLTTNQSECVEQIMEGGNHLLKLINDILDLAKIESGKIQLSLEELNLKDELDECLNLIYTLAKEHKIKIINNYKTNKDVFIKADRTRLKQVLLNILSNAIKYNKKEGVIIIGYENVLNNMLRISIGDTGLGISKNNQEKLFTPFTRFGAESSNIEGTGIGLTVTKSLITLMNGNITFKSEIGEGTTFWVDIPLSKDEVENELESINQNIIDESIPDNLSGTLLYIEDNQANIRLMERVIEQSPGLFIISANNAEKGIALAKSELPDVIILDINLPGMDGFEALDVLKGTTETKHIPVMALSAFAAKENIEKGIAAGFRHYLTKPINVTDVMTAIESLLKKDSS